MSQFIGWGSGKSGSISAATGTVNTYAAATGTAGSATVITALSVAVGDLVLLHQSVGTGVGNCEFVNVKETGSGQFTSDRNLANSYGTGAQAVSVPQYSAETCGNNLTATAWNGTVGGILALHCNGEVTFSGSVSVNANGYRGGSSVNTSYAQGIQGEGATGTGAASQSANGIGGGGGPPDDGGAGGFHDGAGGGGGGYATSGAMGATNNSNGLGGAGGGTVGAASLTSLYFGGGGGSGGEDNVASGSSGAGGIGGGIICITAKKITVTGTISANGQKGNDPSQVNQGGGGGGGGGSVLLLTQEGVLGSGKITATGGGASTGANYDGGAGGEGRIHLAYYSSYTGTTNPTLDVAQNTALTSQVFTGMI